jgi:hypothetical protein
MRVLKPVSIVLAVLGLALIGRVLVAQEGSPGRWYIDGRQKTEQNQKKDKDKNIKSPSDKDDKDKDDKDKDGRRR